MAGERKEYIVKRLQEEMFMCQNIFRNDEESKRREAFTRLFVTLAINNVQIVKLDNMPERLIPNGAFVDTQQRK